MCKHLLLSLIPLPRFFYSSKWSQKYTMRRMIVRLQLQIASQKMLTFNLRLRCWISLKPRLVWCGLSMRCCIYFRILMPKMCWHISSYYLCFTFKYTVSSMIWVLISYVSLCSLTLCAEHHMHLIELLSCLTMLFRMRHPRSNKCWWGPSLLWSTLQESKTYCMREGETKSLFTPYK